MHHVLRESQGRQVRVAPRRCVRRSVTCQWRISRLFSSSSSSALVTLASAELHDWRWSSGQRVTEEGEHLGQHRSAVIFVFFSVFIVPYRLINIFRPALLQSPGLQQKRGRCVVTEQTAIWRLTPPCLDRSVVLPDPECREVSRNDTRIDVNNVVVVLICFSRRRQRLVLRQQVAHESSRADCRMD